MQVMYFELFWILKLMLCYVDTSTGHGLGISDSLTVVNAGTATSERVRGFFENTYNILTISNKKVQVDLKIVGGKRLSIDEIVNNYSQFTTNEFIYR